jgi:hypothetical protein
MAERVQDQCEAAALIKALPFAVDDYPLKNGFYNLAKEQRHADV